MKKYQGALFTFAFAAMLLCFTPVLRANAGWETTDSGTKYKISGTQGYATGLCKIDGKRYYFDSNGVMKTGFVTVDGNKYYFGTDGAAQTGLFTVDGKKYYGRSKTGRLCISCWKNNYYFQSDGSAAVSTWVGNKWVNSKGKYEGKQKTGWVELEGNKYYYSTKTKYETGWFTVSGKYYYADSKGVLQTNKWIGDSYVNAKGVRVTGMKTIGKKTYIFDSNGKRYKKQWVHYKKNYYYVNKNGVVKKNTWVRKKYYVNADGVRVTGWQTIDGKKYYFGAKGVKKTGFQTISGSKYYFESSGALVTSAWIDDNYYAGSSGVLLTGLQEVDGELYYFKSSGKKVTKKLKKVGTNKYYFLPTSGQAVRDMRVYYGTSFYYFDENGKMVTSKWVNQYYYGANGAQEKYRKDDGWWKADNTNETYYYRNGSAVTGLQTIDGYKYYFDSKGIMQTGIISISGNKYYFGTDGKMVTSTTIIVGSTQYTINSSGVVTNEKSLSVSGNSKGAQIANFAIKYVGNPYVYGGTSLTNGADCSGFVQTVFANFGYKLLRTADEQMKGPSSSQIKSSGYTKGTSVTVSKSSLQPGDLLFYGTSSYASHVAIYIGNGQIVHASNSQAYPAGGIKISDWDYQTPVKAMRYWS